MTKRTRMTGTTKRTRMIKKGRDTRKRTSTGNETTYSGGKSNEDFHGRKNYHRMTSMGTEKAGDRREDRYNQRKTN